MSIYIKYYLRVLTLIIATSSVALAQFPKPAEKEGTLRTTSEYALGAKLTTVGLGAKFRYAWQKNYEYTNYFDFSLTYIRHPKEIKSLVLNFNSSKSYYFGKLNAFWQLRPQFGGRKTLFPAKRKEGVEISWIWGGGFSLGLTKPVYLKVRKLTEEGNYIEVEEKYNPDEHRVDNIFGGASWFRGLSEINARPGINAKTGFYFDFTNDTGFMLGAELGLAIDAYFEKIPILANESNKAIYTILYADILIGKKNL